MNLSTLCRTKLGACMLVLTSAMTPSAWSASLGQTALPPSGEDGPVTVYYPSVAKEQPVRRGRLTLQLAADAPAQPGNGRLIVISHGSGGSPWVHADLARALVEAGYVVALPEHHADNYRDDSRPGPDSWTLRPAEVSRAIDAIGRDARFAPLLQLDKVGVYGMSAGGHTALTLAGGRWSPARFARHCAAHIAEDFPACVGLFTHLSGGPLDGFKEWLALRVIESRFDDDRVREYQDPRVAAVVAAVPAAADFDLSSLTTPRVPLALVLAEQDRWLAPRFHGGAVRNACRTCEVIADMRLPAMARCCRRCRLTSSASPASCSTTRPASTAPACPKSIARLRPSSRVTCRPHSPYPLCQWTKLWTRGPSTTRFLVRRGL